MWLPSPAQPPTDSDTYNRQYQQQQQQQQQQTTMRVKGLINKAKHSMPPPSL
jgi:hypothetical protein